MNRRKFLGSAALAAAALAGCRSSEAQGPQTVLRPTTEESAGLGPEESTAIEMARGRAAIRLITVEADGSPLSTERLRTLHARDLRNDPLPQAIVLSAGSAQVELNREEPIQLSMRLSVPGFGEVYCYADNAGHGYTRSGTIEFVVEAARTRAARIGLAYEKLCHSGLQADKVFDEHLSLAKRPIPSSPPAARLAAAYDRLSHGLHAGERLAINAANLRISRFAAPRHDFYFGAAISGYDHFGKPFQDRIKEAFNFATANWYTWKPAESAIDPIDYGRMDASLDWCWKNNITPKGFGYLYMTRGATPTWLRPIEAATQPGESMGRRSYNAHWPRERLKTLYHDVIATTMKRYDGKLKYAEIMNEAHDKANLWQMNHEEILDMAKMAFAAAREGSATVKRQMNHCCMWAEYAKRRNDDGSRRWSPWQFVKACFDDGIDYEVIGLQLYYPQNDLFEIDRMLDRFAIFNKPLHITEIATASQDGLDSTSMRPHTYAPGWHGPWNPSMQADWLESIYTLVYSKPSFEAIGWWDMTDVPGHFWPFGGLLDKDLHPKPSYLRLRKLQQRWGVSLA